MRDYINWRWWNLGKDINDFNKYYAESVRILYEFEKTCPNNAFLRSFAKNTIKGMNDISNLIKH
ncbi:MAG: hypothetical protein ACD_4C00384G0002 [uncultured bacterium (gcode 4)]|uniref:Uncharacterized protein n=1 Tax=uncultured bacterium (gcode 4) TaxID=1234023 RepID=K2F560_9BACT|nr:MAG: hypothetical protein ACD_4C00384G0002 [uncultured bacterium (gcode 4)]